MYASYTRKNFRQRPPRRALHPACSRNPCVFPGTPPAASGTPAYFPGQRPAASGTPAYFPDNARLLQEPLCISAIAAACSEQPAVDPLEAAPAHGTGTPRCFRRAAISRRWPAQPARHARHRLKGEFAGHPPRSGIRGRNSPKPSADVGVPPDALYLNPRQCGCPARCPRRRLAGASRGEPVVLEAEAEDQAEADQEAATGGTPVALTQTTRGAPKPSAMWVSRQMLQSVAGGGCRPRPTHGAVYAALNWVASLLRGGSL